jgi:hypothetical protein
VASYVRPITRVDNDNFDYDLNGTAGPALSAGQFSSWGLRLVTQVRGLINTGTTVDVTIPGHGYGGVGATLGCVYLMDGDLTWVTEWYSSWCTTATVKDVDTLTLPVNTGTIQAAYGATSNTAQVNVPAHEFSTRRWSLPVPPKAITARKPSPASTPARSASPPP